MFRKALLLASLLIITACLAAMAQSPPTGTSAGNPSRVRSSTFRRPTLPGTVIPAAATEQAGLSDRLRSVRSQVVSDSSVTDSAPEAFDPVAGSDRVSTQSVLVKRGRPMESTGVSEPGVLPPGIEPIPERDLKAPAQASISSSPSGGSTIAGVPSLSDMSTPRVASRPVPSASRPAPSLSPPQGRVAYHAPPSSRGTQTAPTSESQLTVTGTGPMLQIETVGPQAISVGKEANYRIRIVNQGTTEADGVLVQIELPRSVQIVSTAAVLGTTSERGEGGTGRTIIWEMDRVAAKSQQELEMVVKPTENTPIDLRVDWICRPPTLEARIEVQQPRLAIAIQGVREMRHGETAVFKVQLSNPGNGPAEDVSVSLGATGATDQPNAVGTVAAGETRELEVELTAKQAGMMQIHASAGSGDGLHAEAIHEVRVRRADLAVTITAPQLVYADSIAIYQIRVANQGDAVAPNVLLKLSLPSGATNGVGIDKKPIADSQPQWQIGDLTAGAERIFTMQCSLTSGGENRLIARIQDAENLAASAAAVTLVEAIADLKLIVNDPKGPIPAGQTVVYEVQIVNRGSKEARDINLIAQFSEGIEPLAAKGQRSEIVPGQVLFDTIKTLPAGTQVSLEITARAEKSGNLRFRAELTCGDPETKLVAEENTRFFTTATPTTAPTETSGQSAERTAGVPTPARR